MSWKTVNWATDAHVGSPVRHRGRLGGIRVDQQRVGGPGFAAEALNESRRRAARRWPSPMHEDSTDLRLICSDSANLSRRARRWVRRRPAPAVSPPTARGDGHRPWGIAQREVIRGVGFAATLNGDVVDGRTRSRLEKGRRMQLPHLAHMDTGRRA